MTQRMYIKKAIKEKIAIYKPLDFKTAYQAFLERFEEEGENEIGDDLIKNFLIERAYFALEEGDCILRLVKKKLDSTDESDIMVQERVDYIHEQIEKNGFERLKKFAEKSSFKTYLYTVATRLFLDFWRTHYQARNDFRKYENDYKELFDAFQEGSEETFIHLEGEEFLRKAAELLPKVLAKLDDVERLALKMKYEKGMKVSAIARTIGDSHYKARQLLKDAEYKIKKEILSRLKDRGGSHEAPGR